VQPSPFCGFEAFRPALTTTCKPSGSSSTGRWADSPPYRAIAAIFSCAKAIRAIWGAGSGSGFPTSKPPFEQYQGTAAKLRHAPTNYQWALEMQVEDLDGNVLRRSDPKKDEPVGEWLDMNGNRWMMSAEKEWVQVKTD